MKYCVLRNREPSPELLDVCISERQGMAYQECRQGGGGGGGGGGHT